MKLITLITPIVAVALLGFSARGGTAQVGPGAEGAEATKPAAIPSAALELIEQGDLLITERKYGKARNEYRAAAELIRETGGFPVLALRRISSAYYFQGWNQHAVSALDRLAEEAAQVGDVVAQAWALADAAWILGVDCTEIGDRERRGGVMALKQRALALRQLLDSPYLPAEVRSEVSEKRCGGCHTAAGPPRWARR